MINTIDGSFITEPPNNIYLIIDNFDEHFLDDPNEYGIVAYDTFGELSRVYFKSLSARIAFLRDNPDPRNPTG